MTVMATAANEAKISDLITNAAEQVSVVRWLCVRCVTLCVAELSYTC
jgi:hypothetical protein